MTDPFFDRIGPEAPAHPVVFSVPHAGRDYPAALVEVLAVPFCAVRLLEDRHVDAVALAALGGSTALVQRHARAWIDLNRREDERDPLADEGAAPLAGRAPEGARLRGGLGLVPRRSGGHDQLWRRRWTDAEVRERIAGDHRPYHDRLAGLLAVARQTFGTAVLLDVHSMPPLPGRARARLVIGARPGARAAAALLGVGGRGWGGI